MDETKQKELLQIALKGIEAFHQLIGWKALNSAAGTFRVPEQIYGALMENQKKYEKAQTEIHDLKMRLIVIDTEGMNEFNDANKKVLDGTGRGCKDCVYYNLDKCIIDPTNHCIHRAENYFKAKNGTKIQQAKTDCKAP